MRDLSTLFPPNLVCRAEMNTFQHSRVLDILRSI
jgi:hypothetical protein